MVAISLAVQMLITTCLGIFIRKINLVNNDFSSQLSKFVMNIPVPCTVFYSITSQEFSPEKLKSCFLMIILGFAVCGFTFLIGQIIYILSKKSPRGRLARYAMVLNHFSFMGTPVIDRLYGEAGNSYYAVFLIPVRIVYYGFSKILLTPPSGEKQKFSGKALAKSMLVPSVIAIPVALIFWVAGWQLPSFIMAPIKSLHACTTPLGLVLCGLIIGKYNIKDLIRPANFIIPIMRTILCPALFLVITRLLILAGVEKLMADIIFIYSALPVSALMATYTIQSDPNPQTQFEAAGCTIIATLMSIVTIPIWYTIISRI